MLNAMSTNIYGKTTMSGMLKTTTLGTNMMFLSDKNILFKLRLGGGGRVKNKNLTDIDPGLKDEHIYTVMI